MSGNSSPDSMRSVPQIRRVLRRAVELEAELSRVAGTRNPTRDAAHGHRFGQEPEVAQRLQVGAVGDRAEQLAGLRSLDLQVGHLRGAILDLDLERAVRGD